MLAGQTGNCPFPYPSADNSSSETHLVFAGGHGLARPITVKIKRLASGGHGLPLPARMTAQSAGFDLPAAVEKSVVLKPREIKLIPCGFAMAVPDGYEAQVRPRSGL